MKFKFVASLKKIAKKKKIRENKSKTVEIVRAQRQITQNDEVTAYSVDNVCDLNTVTISKLNIASSPTQSTTISTSHSTQLYVAQENNSPKDDTSLSASIHFIDESTAQQQNNLELVIAVEIDTTDENISQSDNHNITDLEPKIVSMDTIKSPRTPCILPPSEILYDENDEQYDTTEFLTNKENITPNQLQKTDENTTSQPIKARRRIAPIVCNSTRNDEYQKQYLSPRSYNAIYGQLQPKLTKLMLTNVRKTEMEQSRVKSTRQLTTPRAPVLKSEDRLKQRREFDRIASENRQAKEEEAEKMLKEKQERELLEFKQLHCSSMIKANPIRKYSPLKVIRPRRKLHPENVPIYTRQMKRKREREIELELMRKHYIEVASRRQSFSFSLQH